jgi:DNA polymerase-3 subunit epsilon
LDALCQRYSVSNEHRVLHGALLDARLLADVYMAMTRGQESLVMAADDDLEADPSFAIDSSMIVVRRASEQECAAHEAILQEIDKVSGGQTVWRHQNSNA